MHLKALAKDWPFTLFILFLVSIKINILYLPIYWDETIYFTPEIFNQGLAIFLPQNYDPIIFHGHPIFLQILLYPFGLVFGENPLSAHILSLCIMIYFYCISYIFFNKFCDRNDSLSILVLFSLFPYIFIQSSSFIPNYLMIALAFHALYFFNKKNMILFCLFSLLSVMTRESALALFTYPLIVSLKRKDIKLISICMIPFVTLALFFIYNKLISGMLINHPYVLHRSETNMLNLEFLKNSLDKTFKVLYHCTFVIFPLLIKALLPIAFIVTLYKKVIKFSHELLWMLLSSLGFLIFFILYADNAQRNFTFITLTFSVLCVLIFKHVIKKNILVKLLIIIISVNTLPEHFNAFRIDNTWASHIFKSLASAKLIQRIEKKQKPFLQVKCAWPCLTFMRSPSYGYTSKVYKTSYDDQNSDLLIDSKLFSSIKNIPLDFKYWEVTLQYNKGTIRETRVYSRRNDH